MSGCAKQESKQSVDFNQLYLSMTDKAYAANLTVRGEDELLKIYPEAHLVVEDYLIVTSDDPLNYDTFIFLRIPIDNSIDTTESINRYLSAKELPLGVSLSRQVASALVYHDSDYLIYVLADDVSQYRTFLEEYFK